MARGGFKQKRGGGRSFSKHLELNADGVAVSSDPKSNRKRDGEDEDDSEEDDSDEEESEEESEEEDEQPTSSKAPQAELTRTERRELKKAGKKPQAAAAKADEDDDEEEDPIFKNPNVTVGKKLTISDLDAPRELTRREKEAKTQKEAKDKYWKLHEQGKTDQAKVDLARLAKIRAEREAAQAKRKAEQDAKAKELDAKKEAQKGRRV